MTIQNSILPLLLTAGAGAILSVLWRWYSGKDDGPKTDSEFDDWQY